MLHIYVYFLQLADDGLDPKTILTFYYNIH